MPNRFKGILFSLLFVKLFAYTDLGTFGNVYEISEPDLMQVIKKSYKDFNKSKVYSDFKKSLKKYLTVNIQIPKCKQSTNSVFDPTVVLTHDIDMPKYNIHIKKGTKFNPLKYATLNKYIMFIDAEDVNQLELAKKYAAQAFIIVVNGNIEQVSRYTGKQAYKADRVLIKAFKVKCVPSIYIQRGEKYQKIEITFKKKDTE